MFITSNPGPSGRPPASSLVAVELFGVPRVRGNASVIRLEAATLGELARRMSERHPDLAREVLDPETGWVNRGYTFVVDGRFSRDRDQTIDASTDVLLVASASGG
jgi:molybdopterin converting factor small subunit